MDKLDKRRIFNVIKSLFTGFDGPLALIVFLLLGTGLVALYSAAIDMPAMPIMDTPNGRHSLS